MKIQFPILILMLILLVNSGDLPAQSVSFSPARIFFKGNPGETVSELVTVNNSGTEAYEFRVHLKDWKRDSLGNKVYLEMGTLPNSNAKSVGLPWTSFNIAPGEKKTIPISMTIPQKELDRTSNSMLFFTQTNAQKQENQQNNGIGIKMSLELGIQLFHTPFGTQKGDFRILAFERRSSTLEEKKSNILALKFENTGYVNKDASLRFELTNKQNGKELQLKSIPVMIMPLDKQWVYSPIDLEEGEYLAVAILDSGDTGNLKIAEKTIYVKK